MRAAPSCRFPLCFDLRQLLVDLAVKVVAKAAHDKPDHAAPIADLCDLTEYDAIIIIGAGARLGRGVVIVGLDHGHAGQMTLHEVTGGSLCGATTIAGGEGPRQPSENELTGARRQGRKIAEQ